MDGREILALLPRLRRYARALVGDHAAADDLVQDTLERAWTRMNQQRPGSDLRIWLFAIMHNLRIDQARRPTLHLRSMEAGDLDLPTRATQTDNIEIAELDAVLQQLPEDQQAILLLVSLEEMTYAQVAETLDLPLGTVMSRLSRARDRLRERLDRQPSSTQLRVIR